MTDSLHQLQKAAEDLLVPSRYRPLLLRGEFCIIHHGFTVPVVTLVTTAELIIPELITPGNHLRWDAGRVREQVRTRCQRDE